MLVELPSIDMEQIADLDRQQAYWILFQYMKDDFVTKKDLALMFANAKAGTYPVVTAPMEVFAQVQALIYKALAELGGVVREGVIFAGEKLVSGE